MNLTLHYSPGACSLAAHIALAESGASFATRELSINDGETRSEAYLAINPRGQVPALDIDGVVITEVPAILTFVARAFPDAELLPPSLTGEARCLSMVAWFSSEVHPTFAHVVRPDRIAASAATAEVARLALVRYFDLLREIDAVIRSGPWLMGEQFTIADAYALPLWGFGRLKRLPMEELVSFTGWKQRMLERPAVMRVLVAERSRLLPR